MARSRVPQIGVPWIQPSQLVHSSEQPCIAVGSLERTYKGLAHIAISLLARTAQNRVSKDPTIPSYGGMGSWLDPWYPESGYPGSSPLRMSTPMNRPVQEWEPLNLAKRDLSIAHYGLCSDPS